MKRKAICTLLLSVMMISAHDAAQARDLELNLTFDNKKLNRGDSSFAIFYDKQGKEIKSYYLEIESKKVLKDIPENAESMKVVPLGFTQKDNYSFVHFEPVAIDKNANSVSIDLKFQRMFKTTFRLKLPNGEYVIGRDGYAVNVVDACDIPDNASMPSHDRPNNEGEYVVKTYPGQKIMFICYTAYYPLVKLTSPVFTTSDKNVEFVWQIPKFPELTVKFEEIYNGKKLPKTNCMGIYIRGCDQGDGGYPERIKNDKIRITFPNSVFAHRPKRLGFLAGGGYRIVSGAEVDNHDKLTEHTVVITKDPIAAAIINFTVIGKESGQPLKAKLFLSPSGQKGGKKDYEIWNGGKVLSAPGLYDVIIYAQGYNMQRINNLSLKNNQTLSRKVALTAAAELKVKIHGADTVAGCALTAMGIGYIGGGPVKNGEYACRIDRRSQPRLLVAAPDKAAKLIALDDGTPEQIEVALTDGQYVRGKLSKAFRDAFHVHCANTLRIVYGESAPLKKREKYILNFYPVFYPHVSVGKAETDANGDWFVKLEPGEYEVVLDTDIPGEVAVMKTPLKVTGEVKEMSLPETFFAEDAPMVFVDRDVRRKPTGLFELINE